MKTKHIAIFASGSGSNARKILEYFDNRADINVSIIISNKKNAGVLTHAKEFDVPTLHIDKDYFHNNQCILDVLKAEKIDLIVLAGFLWLVPAYLVASYSGRILNIHPALLPKYGGKGMYGHHVHKAVKANHETESGMTIHFVNERFDEGDHVFQAKCALSPNDTPEDIAAKVLRLEHKHYAEIIDQVISKQS